MKLGTLYRKYLRGDDLNGKQYTVKIIAAKLVEVQPHPTAPKQDKWCLFVAGIPEDLPNGILFGPKGEAALVKIFGNVEITSLENKTLIIYPYPIKVSGVQKNAIGFKAVNGSQPLQPRQEGDIFP